MGKNPGGGIVIKIYFISKNHLIGMGGILALLVVFLGVSLLYYNQVGMASRMNEPVYQGNTGEKVLAITVNVDWGEEYIPAMLEEFAENEVQATFFVTGSWAEKNPQLVKKISQAGHSVQNHGYKHVHFNSLSESQAVEQIKKTEKIIEEQTGKKTRFFASPYGEQNRQLMNAVSSINYDLIMWSIDTIDWQHPDPATIVKRVVNKVHNDAIILMHPTDPTVKALPELLDSLQEKGYKMVTIDQILLDKDEKKQ